jgi:hypothetical protein
MAGGMALRTCNKLDCVAWVKVSICCGLYRSARLWRIKLACRMRTDRRQNLQRHGCRDER